MINHLQYISESGLSSTMNAYHPEVNAAKKALLEMKLRNQMKILRFRLPTQLPIQGQWWSS